MNAKTALIALMLSCLSFIPLASADTNSKGHFEFTGEQTKSYKLISGSKSYDVVAPTSLIQSGDQVTLQLQQK